VFGTVKSKGLHHEAFNSEEEALQGHERIVKLLGDGQLEFTGVSGPYGNPSMTAEEWRQRSNKQGA
jgi:hypothetical protein